MAGYIKRNYNCFQGISRFQNKYGSGIKLEKFHNDFALIFEPRSSYYRVDIQIELKEEIKKAVYDILSRHAEEIEYNIGHKIGFGNQWYRFKIDINEFDNYKYKSWGEKEFRFFREILDRIIKTYSHYLEALQHGWIR